MKPLCKTGQGFAEIEYIRRLNELKFPLMRVLPFSITAVVTLALVWALNRNWGTVPAMGAFLSPQQGFWQNAEPAGKPASLDIHLPDLEGKVDVYLDDRLVPHVFAEKAKDAIYVQGYLHAKYRLWQMEFQTHAAGGRLSEILGAGPEDRILQFDRQMRRLGMVYAAKNALVEAEKDPVTREIGDAYTSGVNAYIHELTAAQLPVEYKLLGYTPEPWTNLKTCLFLKYMSLDLAGPENDFEMTNARSVLPKDLFDLVYPITQDSLDPVIPKGTLFDTPAVKVKIPALADSLYFDAKQTAPIERIKPDKDNGSNNWAVAGSKTQSGRPILCNDPHLALNMPSLWYEMQLHTPEYNAYGASFPGAPGVIIGFNDSVSFGFTNAMRDVRDYYAITFKDDTRSEYKFNGEWKSTVFNIDTFAIKGRGVFYDTVAYTLFGPVMYDSRFTGLGETRTDGRNYAVRWKAHDPSNELKFFYSLDRARNYDDYYEALQYLTCPGQNCLFATKSGTIALWQQAIFPAKWKRQGDFIMPGTDSTFMWQGYIPRNENPHQVNPERGFVSSANQLPVDTTYPYYIGGHHDLYRGKLINRYLSGMTGITPRMMQQLQTENYNLFAETALPLLLMQIDQGALSADEKKYLSLVETWNFRNDPDVPAPTVFANWFDSLEVQIWGDEFAKIPKPWDWPDQYVLIEGLLRDSVFKFTDDISTPEVETLSQQITAAFKKAVPALAALEKEGKLGWSKYKDSGIQHLLRQSALSRFHLTTGGGTHVINATKKFHGPSWRMIVHMTDETEAYGIYPGGQSGNPGSPYYDSFVDDWAAGKYYPLWVMKKEEAEDKRVVATLRFGK